MVDFDFDCTFEVSSVVLNGYNIQLVIAFSTFFKFILQDKIYYVSSLCTRCRSRWMRLRSLGLSLGEWQNLDVLFCHCWAIKGSYQLPGSLSTVWSWDTFEASETVESQWIPWTYHSDQNLQTLISVSMKPEVNLASGRSHVWYLDPTSPTDWVYMSTQHRSLLSKLYQPNMTIYKFWKIF